MLKTKVYVGIFFKYHQRAEKVKRVYQAKNGRKCRTLEKYADQGSPSCPEIFAD